MSSSRIAIVLIALSAPVLAQDTTRVPLPAITVDVLRSGVALERAPLALTRRDALATSDHGPGISIEEALRALPGVQLDNRHNQALGERLSVRGFGARAGFGIRGVRVLVDGIPATMPDGQTTLNHIDPSNIVALELLRGPGAAFLGNAAGGALQLRTGVRGNRVEYTTGAGGLHRLAGSGARGAASVHASWQQQHGFRDYSDSERLLLGATYGAQRGANRLEAALHATRYDARNPGSLTLEQLAADRTQANGNNVRQKTGEKGSHAQLGGGWIRPLGPLRMELRAHAGVRQLDNPIPPRIIEVERVFVGARAQLVAASARSTLAGGVELDALRDDRRNWTNAEGARGEIVLDQRERVRAAAAFLHAQAQPIRAVRVMGAVRHDATRFSAADAHTTDGNDSGARDLDATSFSVGAGAEPAAGWLLFVNAGTAFETPTTTELANREDGRGGFNATLEPERTMNYEAGARFESRHTTAELSVFRADVRDKLIAYEVPSVPGRQFYRNAGRARHQGAEASLEVRPASALMLHASWTALDARFRSYLVDNIDLAGRRIPGVAAYQWALGARLTPLEATSFTADIRRTGRVAVNDANSAFAPAYTVAHVRGDWHGLQFSTVTAGVYVGIENVLDAAYTAAVTVNAFGGRYYEPGPARALYAGLRLQLD